MLFLFALAYATLRRGAQAVWINRYAAGYMLFFIVLFTLLYWLLGMKKHFFVPDYLAGRENGFLNSFYTSVLAQSNAMPDTVPKTNMARMLFMAQVCSGWLWFLIFVNPLAT